jgi:hypothetical protein
MPRGACYRTTDQGALWGGGSEHEEGHHAKFARTVSQRTGKGWVFSQ